MAEQKGIPKVEMSSLAHPLQNMWLKTVALGLNFQLLSITELMGEDVEFCRLIGIDGSEFAINGCFIGYPDGRVPERKGPKAENAVRWL